MALYAKPVRLLMKDMVSGLAGEGGSTFTKN
jgi:hypothetical protein